jgi:hypothetical protein
MIAFLAVSYVLYLSAPHSLFLRPPEEDTSAHERFLSHARFLSFSHPPVPSPLPFSLANSLARLLSLSPSLSRALSLLSPPTHIHHPLSRTHPRGACRDDWGGACQASAPPLSCAPRLVVSSSHSSRLCLLTRVCYLYMCVCVCVRARECVYVWVCVGVGVCRCGCVCV